MNPHREYCEDWIVRAKRGGLSESEQRQFHELLTSSLEARLLYEASCAFDRESCVVAGDDARLERIARQLQKRHQSWRRRIPRRSLAQGIVAAILIAGTAVGAASYSKTVRHWLALPEATGDSQKNTGAARKSAKPRMLASPLVNRQLAEPPLPARRTQPSPSPQATARHAEAVAKADRDVASVVTTKPIDVGTGRFDDIAEPSATAPSSRDLFAEANRARVQGTPTQAAALYERLVAQFPQSREAAAARISLGMLYLQRGRAAQALVQFQTYDSKGPLSAEGVWGEAQAYRALGQFDNERRALERIVRDMPQSAYVSAAKRRLSE
jgi:TolA-binding protein